MSIQSEIKRVEKELKEYFMMANEDYLELTGYLKGLKFAQSECDKMLQAQREDFIKLISNWFEIPINSKGKEFVCNRDDIEMLIEELTNQSQQHLGDNAHTMCDSTPVDKHQTISQCLGDKQLVDKDFGGSGKTEKNETSIVPPKTQGCGKIMELWETTDNHKCGKFCKVCEETFYCNDCQNKISEVKE